MKSGFLRANGTWLGEVELLRLALASDIADESSLTSVFRAAKEIADELVEFCFEVRDVYVLFLHPC